MASYNIESLAFVDALVDVGNVADDVVDVLDGWTGSVQHAHDVRTLQRGALLLRNLAGLREGKLSAADAFVQLDSLDYVGAFGFIDSTKVRLAIEATEGSHQSLTDLAASAEALAMGNGGDQNVSLLISLFDGLAEVTVAVARSAGRATTERDTWMMETPS